MARTTSIWLFTAALACGGCGDDDDDGHGDHDHDDGGAARGGSNGGGGGNGGRGGDGGRGGVAIDPRGASGGSGGNGGNGGSSGGGAGGDASVDEDGGGGDAEPMTFFVSSEGSMTGDLGGLSGADARCERLAQAVGRGGATWRAYLSADGGGTPIHARDRIGAGPWHNSKGQLLAATLTALHALPSGGSDLFLDEKGAKVPGQWMGSPTPNAHDILTGSTADGMLMAGKTCESWTSASADLAAQVGHCDGLGPMMNPDPPYNSWNSSHENGGCNDTVPRGGAGRIYCFASD